MNVGLLASQARMRLFNCYGTAHENTSYLLFAIVWSKSRYKHNVPIPLREYVNNAMTQSQFMPRYIQKGGARA